MCWSDQITGPRGVARSSSRRGETQKHNIKTDHSSLSASLDTALGGFIIFLDGYKSDTAAINTRSHVFYMILKRKESRNESAASPDGLSLLQPENKMSSVVTGVVAKTWSGPRKTIKCVCVCVLK